MTLISVIIPSYRQPQFLGRAIESCLEQDHTDLEVIVIEDYSRDSSLGVAAAIARTDRRVRVFEAHENGGLGRARNLGIARSNGEYLCFLDSDDYLLPGSLSARLAAMPAAIAEHGEAVVAVYGDWQHVGEDIDDVTPRAPRSNMGVVSAETYSGENVFICSAPLVRRDRVVAAGGFPEGLPMLEDFALWARLISEGGIFVPVQHVVATYRQRQNSMLRGDRVVVMADYVSVINNDMKNRDCSLSDGGAMTAWLKNERPHSFGRMTWNVPSVLGNYGSGPGAKAVVSIDGAAGEQVVGLDDFMNAAPRTGLIADARELDLLASSGDVYAAVSNPLEALEVVGLSERLRKQGQTLAAVVDDASDHFAHWPLDLAGVSISSKSDVPADAEYLDLRSQTDGVNSGGLAQLGADYLWDPVTERSGALVYVTDILADYPALNAWVSVALRALADEGFDAELVADRRGREALAAWRATPVSFDQLRRSEVVIVPPHTSATLAQLAEVLCFDPLHQVPNAPRTAAELREVLATRRR